MSWSNWGMSFGDVDVKIGWQQCLDVHPCRLTYYGCMPVIAPSPQVGKQRLSMNMYLDPQLPSIFVGSLYPLFCWDFHLFLRGNWGSRYKGYKGRDLTTWRCQLLGQRHHNPSLCIRMTEVNNSSPSIAAGWMTKNNNNYRPNRWQPSSHYTV